MIYQITGEIVSYDANTVILDCNGVGYGIYISGNTLGRISGKTGQRVTLLTYMKVSEDAIDLYGFWEAEERDAFRLLISVSGVGAKSAVSILSFLTPSALSGAVASGDAKSISKAQGIGSKTAQRIILELKDKISAVSDSDTEFLSEGIVSEGKSVLNDAVDTLMVLGYRRGDAMQALREIDMSNTPLEEVVRLALKKMAK